MKFLVVFILTFFAAKCFACSCRALTIEKADTIFEAKVIKQSHTKKSAKTAKPLTEIVYELVVMKTYRSIEKLPKNLKVITRIGSGATCRIGHALTKGETYLFLKDGKRIKDWKSLVLPLSLCSRYAKKSTAKDSKYKSIINKLSTRR